MAARNQTGGGGASSRGSRSLLPWKPSDWSMTGWNTADKTGGGTLLDMLGLRDLGLQYPKLTAKLPAATGSAKGNSNPGSGTVPPKGGLQTYARNLLSKYGWSGQWDSFNNIVNAESGWNPLVANRTSGAYGIAQALGHGDNASQGTYANEYGGYGLTDAQAKAANSGNGYYQVLWMMNYIQSRYGSPDVAWQYHLAAGSY